MKPNKNPNKHPLDFAALAVQIAPVAGACWVLAMRKLYFQGTARFDFIALAVPIAIGASQTLVLPTPQNINLGNCLATVGQCLLSLAVSELAHTLAWAPPSNVDRGERWYNSPRCRTPPATLEGPSVQELYSKTVYSSNVNILAGGKLFYLDAAITIRKI